MPPPVGYRTPFLVFGIGALLLLGAAYLLFLRQPPSLAEARYRDVSLPIEERVDDLISRMTLEEKIGQMTLIEKNSIYDLSVVSRYGLGAVLSGSGAKPEVNTPEGWKEMIRRFVQESRGSRTGIPILYGLDANHGHGNVPGATIFPHAIGLGAAGDPDLTERVARATAREALATGALWIYSPSLDLPSDIRWGRVYEAFSDDPMLAGAHGAATVRGLRSEGALAAPKHFIGAGSMEWGSSIHKSYSIDQGRTPADEAALRDVYLPPFEEAVRNGAQSIMVGLNEWGDEQTSANQHLITDVLKNELGFQGFVVSDWYGVYEISDSKYESSVRAINAGVDMVMLPFEYELFIRDVERAVYRGDITENRIDDAVRRILRVKFALGLVDDLVQPPPISIIGSAEHRLLAREAAARSLVLLKNDGVFPLSTDIRKIRVAGSAADNIGMQTGAWTVEWQGIDGNWLPGATSILSGIKQAAGGTVVQYDKDGSFPEKDIADVGIAIVGEKPYAEGWGDDPDPRISAEDLQAIDNLSRSARDIIVIIISGRPLIISDEIRKWDALVAAWLPGSEGAGVADAIFGHTPFSGRLPMHWPQSIEQLPIDWTRGARDGLHPLFPRYFGLTTEVVRSGLPSSTQIIL